VRLIQEAEMSKRLIVGSNTAH